MLENHNGLHLARSYTRQALKTCTSSFLVYKSRKAVGSDL